jgi:hypothetical protein
VWAFGDPRGEIGEQSLGVGERLFIAIPDKLEVQFAYAACGISKLMRTSGLCRIEDSFSSDAGRRHAA